VDVVDRLLGTKKAVDGNGHLPEDAGLITDAAQLTTQRTPWQSVQLARELKRPHSIEVIDGLFEKFQELHGDRGYRDDPAGTVAWWEAEMAKARAARRDSVPSA